MRPPFLNRPSTSMPWDLIAAFWRSMSWFFKTSLIFGMIFASVGMVVFATLVSQAIERYQTIPQEPPIQTIIVDPQHRVQVYDSATQHSWEAFIYRGQLVLIPGTELDLSPKDDQ